MPKPVDAVHARLTKDNALLRSLAHKDEFPQEKIVRLKEAIDAVTDELKENADPTVEQCQKMIERLDNAAPSRP